MWKDFITNQVKMSLKSSALIIVANVHRKLAESVEKKSRVLCACLQENEILTVQCF